MKSTSLAVLAALFYGLHDNEAQAVQLHCKEGDGKCCHCCKPGEDSGGDDGGDGDGGDDGGDKDGGGDDGGGGDGGGGDGGGGGDDKPATTCNVTYKQKAPQYTCNDSYERGQAESVATAKESLWCQGTKGPFNDVSFPPAASSLYYKGKENSEMGNSYRRGVKAWKRVSEMAGSNHSLWGS